MTTSITSSATQTIISAGGNPSALVIENGGIVSGGISSTGVISPSQGVKFPAVQYSSADPNTLDDYEEGTFTPVITGTTTAGAGTYTIQTGNYVKVGRAIHISTNIQWTAHTGTGNMTLSGLPFISSSDNNSQSAFVLGYVNNIALIAGNIAMAINNIGTSVISFRQSPSGGGASNYVPMDTNGGFVISGTYFV